MIQQERKKKKKSMFGMEKALYFPEWILFINIQQYPQAVYLKLSVSEVLVQE